MKLISCYVENFGKLSSYSHTFTEGLNVIVGENGCGKTTLSVFIKAMFYGLDSRKLRTEETDRKRYLPWQRGRYGGALTFSHNEKIYRIERSFSEKASDDKFALYNAETGAISNDYTEAIGEEIFGIDADGLERTLFLSEKKLSVKNQNPTISSKLSNLAGVSADMSNFDVARKALEGKEKEFRHRRGKGGLVWEIKEEISEIEFKLGELKIKKQELSEKEKELSALSERLEEAEKKRSMLEKRRTRAAYLKEYSRKKEEISELLKECESESAFFEKKAVSKKDIREAEEKSIKAKELYQSAKSKRELLATHFVDDSGIAEEHITALKQVINSKNVNKTYHIHLIIVGISLLAGILLGAIIHPLLYLIALISLPTLVLAYLNFRAIAGEKKSDALLSAASDFVYARSGKRESADRIYDSLFEIKHKAASVKKEREELAVSIEKEEEELSRLSLECENFLSLFPTKTDEPYEEISDHLIRKGQLEEQILAKKKELSDYAEKNGIDERDLPKESIELDDDEISRIESELSTTRAAFYSIESRISDISDELMREDEYRERVLELSDALRDAELTHKLIIKASEHLTLAKDRLTSRYLGKMRAAFNRYVSETSGESGESFSLDTDFALRKTENGLTNPSESYSLGQREYYSIITRLALVDALYENVSPFIILDDPFCHFDDKKNAAATALIKKLAENRQIIYLTCSESRSALSSYNEGTDTSPK